MHVLYGLVALLSVASLAGQWLEHGMGVDTRLLHIYVRLTDVDAETNLPTWFQIAVLLVAALLLWSVAARARADGDRWHRHWALLGLAFGLLSLDESATLHEKTIPILQEAFGFDGVLHFAWVVLAIPAVVVFGLAFVRFLLALPARTRAGLLLAGSLYVGGAIGVEMVGSHLFTTIGIDTMTYSVVAGVEELLEMLGMVTLVATVTGYVDRRWTRRQREPRQPSDHYDGREPVTAGTHSEE